MPRLATNPTETYAAIEAVDLAAVPVVCTVRSTPRKEQAALARGLLKKLGVKGVSVTTPSYSMASVVEVRLPQFGREGMTDAEVAAEYEEHRAAERKLSHILAVAFPNHDDRSDYQTDYFDYRWSID